MFDPHVLGVVLDIYVLKCSGIHQFRLFLPEKKLFEYAVLLVWECSAKSVAFLQKLTLSTK